MRKLPAVILLAAMLGTVSQGQQPGNYRNFVVSVYARAYEVSEMADLKKLEATSSFEITVKPHSYRVFQSK